MIGTERGRGIHAPLKPPERSSMAARPVIAVLVVAALSGAAALASAQPPGITQWRSAHEREIVDELTTLVAIPNVAGNDADMRSNADHLAALFQRRGFPWRPGAAPGPRWCSPRSTSPGRRHADALHPLRRPAGGRRSEWTRCQPFAPCL